MDAIVMAGGIPQPGEPLYEVTQGQHKALLDVCGKPMVQWVLDALCGSARVQHVVVIGLPADCGVSCDKTVAWIPNQGDMLDNIRSGLRKVQEINPQANQVLAVSSDIPAITAEMVDWLIDETSKTDLDIYYNVITRQVMEAKYPTSKRSYTHLRDVEVCGGDMNVLRASLASQNNNVWEKIIAARKNVFKQAALIGYDTLFLVIFRLITIKKAVEMVASRLHLTGQAVVCPYAEIGMDVDKPFQLEIIRADLQQRLANEMAPEQL